MGQICELFSELFTYVRLFEQTTVRGELQPSYEEVRGRIATLLEQQDIAAQCQGIPERDYQDARFAVVTWADETILRHTDWRHHNRWQAFPLQLEYYQTQHAGEEVLERLDRLRADQKEVRELYYQCFDLKLIGQYFFERDDEHPPTDIGHEQTPYTPLPVAEPHRISRSSPRPHQKLPAPERRPRQRRLPPALLKGGMAILIGGGGPLVLFLIFLLWPQLRPSELWRQPALPVQQVRSTPSLATEVQQWLDSQPDLLQCSKVSLEAVAPTGSVQLGGRVASEPQRAALLHGVRSLRGVTQVTDSLQLIPRPFCEVVELLEPFMPRGQTPGVALRLNKEGTYPVYYAQENLVLEVQTPPQFAGYVYVDYFTTDQAVWHMFPDPREPQHRKQPGSILTVGEVSGPAPWRIAPPFGLELVTVVTSQTPLFAQPRSGNEPAAAFLHGLRQALTQSTTADVAVTFHFVLTQARP
jgi:type IV/VI secretion system ImpK/VasF family protein